MRLVSIRSPGGYDKLELIEQDDPTPQQGEVLIAVKACGVNFADCCVRMGVYSSAKKYVGWPITPGFEVAGEVVVVGKDVTQFAPGDRVVALTRFGGYASHIALTQEQVFSLPNSIPFEEAAAIPAVFLTAYYAVHELAHPRPGSTVLIHSAAGGVGSSLLQLCRQHGCKTLAVVGATHKIELVQDLGADHVIDTSQEDLWAMVESIQPHGVDVIFDANGPATLRESYQHLSKGGKLVVYGFHTMLSKGRGTPNWLKVVWGYLRTPRFNPLNMTTDNHSVLAFNLSYLFDQMDLLRECMHTLLNWLEEGVIQVPSLTSYDLAHVADAHQDLESGQSTGKLILLP